MDTSVSFLNLLQLVSDDEAWNRLVGLYSPLIRGWLRRFGAATDDIDDVVQEVLTVVFRRFPEFQRQPRAGAFRSWLRTITANCLRDHWRKSNRRAAAVGGSDFGEMVAQLEDPQSGMSRLWNREHDQYVIQYLLEEVRPNFTAQTWRAFQRFALDGRSADEVSQELGISVNAVFIAKSRVMSSLRKQGAGLIDDAET
ncbi:RNA polymerase sigma factor [Blastopirellula marina]|uniref:RNA polymerase subunit sigma-24 n=1 Tax=Blastopirellula marina TaxID=124 RepID=A0A2S8GJA1_9BACT|nr:sigma-70 family RNA polymerase sigma factor [Blastopirellula marina]PQO44104.1 RNA polymerase subunit sigma-24 [Blastopirellula marina]